MNAKNLQARCLVFARKLAIKVLIAIAIAVPIRQVVAMPVRVGSDNVAPELHQGDRALIYRLSSTFRRGDIVAYRKGDKSFVARFDSADAAGFHVNRNDESLVIPKENVIGKVIASTR